MSEKKYYSLKNSSNINELKYFFGALNVDVTVQISNKILFEKFFDGTLSV